MNTIIVLLILAGVSIMTLIGENGLLNRTVSAKQKTEQAGVMENIKLAYQNALIGKYTDNGKSIEIQIKEDLEKIYVGSTIYVEKEEDGTYTVKTPDGTYSIDANGNVSRKDGITVAQNTIVLQIIDGIPQDAVTITPKIEGLEGQKITWEISEGTATDKEKVVLTVEEDKQSATIGIKDGVTEGTAGEVKIKIATSEGKYATVTVTVEKIINISSISISPTTDVTLKASGTTDRTVELTATILPNDATNKEINWTITTEPESGVASLSAITGNTVTVTAGNKGGTVTVTATSVADETKVASKIITVERSLGYFKQEGTVVYYYPGINSTNEERIQITNNPTDEGYIGKYLGMKVNYTPKNKFTNKGTSDNYRLFYIDLDSGTEGEGKYGDGQGTIYLKADSDGKSASIAEYDSNATTITRLYNSLDSTKNKMSQLNKEWVTVDGTIDSPNEKAVSYLCNTNVWEGYTDTGDLDTAKIARYAIGGVPIEMWVDSYNKFIKGNSSILVRPKRSSRDKHR